MLAKALGQKLFVTKPARRNRASKMFVANNLHVGHDDDSGIVLQKRLGCLDDAGGDVFGCNDDDERVAEHVGQVGLVADPTMALA